MEKSYLRSVLLSRFQDPVDTEDMSETAAISFRKAMMNNEIDMAIKNIKCATGPEIIELIKERDLLYRNIEAAPEHLFFSPGYNPMEILYLDVNEADVNEADVNEKVAREIYGESTAECVIIFTDETFSYANLPVRERYVTKADLQKAAMSFADTYQKKIETIRVELSVYGARKRLLNRQAIYLVDKDSFLIVEKDRVILEM